MRNESRKSKAKLRQSVKKIKKKCDGCDDDLLCIQVITTANEKNAPASHDSEFKLKNRFYAMAYFEIKPENMKKIKN